MAHVVFYEKPGCAGNTRQQQLLRAAGHSLELRNLLSWPWDEASLLAFLEPLPVAQWFNRAAPRVKSGEVQPDALTAAQALPLLLAHPLLIRRPLMVVGDEHRVGFDAEQVHAWIGLGMQTLPAGSLEGCAARL